MLYVVRRVILRVVLVLMSGCLPNLVIASEQPARETQTNPAAQVNVTAVQVPQTQASQPAVAHEVNPPPALSTEKTDAPSSGANPAVSSSENAEIGGPVRVLEFVLSTQVEGREPKDIVENFEHANGMAYAFARLSALKNSEITFIWRREGTVQSRFTTTVHASKKWRTFSSVKLRPGHWTVQLLLGQTVLAEKAFTVE